MGYSSAINWFGVSARYVVLLSSFTFLCLMSASGAADRIRGQAQPTASVDGPCKIVKETSKQLVLKLEGESGKGRLSLKYDENPLNLAAFSHLAVAAQNQAGGRLDVRLRVASKTKKSDHPVEGRFFLNADEKKDLRLLMIRDYLPESSPWRQLFGNAKALPGGHQGRWVFVEPEKIKRVEITVLWEGLKGDNNTIRFASPTGVGEYLVDKMHPDELPSPLVDEAGQLVNEKWEGRVNDLAELPVDGKRDLKEYENHPVLPGFSKYGGWLNGPKFEATGRFYPKKVDGRWWFVDPDGYLFWSLGITGVGVGEPTLISGREKLFSDFGDDTDPLFWIYEDRELQDWEKVYNFFYSNLKRKYGSEWQAAHKAVSLGRMRAWGVNTSGAWSLNSLMGNQQVPYTLIIHPELQSYGRHDKIPDPFSDEYKNSLRENLAALARKHKGDPWNLGIFIGNEMHWGNSSSDVPLKVLREDASVPAKKAMIEFLQKRYTGIKALNKAWGVNYENFAAIDGSSKAKHMDVVRKDMEVYLEYYADTYFALCAAAVKEFLPGHLYLGCRFHGGVYKNNPVVQRVATRHCDVISFNIYQVSAGHFDPPADVDRPYLIGEFHFGTGTHGVWGSGLGSAMDLEHQGELYEAYVNEVLVHPNFVGAHWFQWTDHPTTARYDGENYRIGLVSLVDRSYETFTESVKTVARQMYQRREGNEPRILK